MLHQSAMERRAKAKDKAVDLPVDLHSNSLLWPWIVGNEQKFEIMNTSRNEPPPKGVWAHSIGTG